MEERARKRVSGKTESSWTQPSTKLFASIPYLYSKPQYDNSEIAPCRSIYMYGSRGDFIRSIERHRFLGPRSSDNSEKGTPSSDTSNRALPRLWPRPSRPTRRLGSMLGKRASDCVRHDRPLE